MGAFSGAPRDASQSGLFATPPDAPRNSNFPDIDVLFTLRRGIAIAVSTDAFVIAASTGNLHISKVERMAAQTILAWGQQALKVAARASSFHLVLNIVRTTIWRLNMDLGTWAHQAQWFVSHMRAKWLLQPLFDVQDSLEHHLEL